MDTETIGTDLNIYKDLFINNLSVFAEECLIVCALEF